MALTRCTRAVVVYGHFSVQSEARAEGARGIGPVANRDSGSILSNKSPS